MFGPSSITIVTVCAKGGRKLSRLTVDSPSRYLHRFKLTNSPYCACAPGNIQDLLHVLGEYPIFLKERAETEVGTGVRILRENFPDLLSEDENSKMFINFCEGIERKTCKDNGSTAKL